MGWDLLGAKCVRLIRLLQIAQLLRCSTDARTDATSTTTDYRSRACRFTTSTEPLQAPELTQPVHAQTSVREPVLRTVYHH